MTNQSADRVGELVDEGSGELDVSAANVIKFTRRGPGTAARPIEDIDDTETAIGDEDGHTEDLEAHREVERRHAKKAAGEPAEISAELRAEMDKYLLRFDMAEDYPDKLFVGDVDELGEELDGAFDAAADLSDTVPAKMELPTLDDITDDIAARALRAMDYVTDLPLVEADLFLSADVAIRSDIEISDIAVARILGLPNPTLPQTLQNRRERTRGITQALKNLTASPESVAFIDSLRGYFESQLNIIIAEITAMEQAQRKAEEEAQRIAEAAEDLADGVEDESFMMSNLNRTLERERALGKRYR